MAAIDIFHYKQNFSSKNGFCGKILPFLMSLLFLALLSGCKTQPASLSERLVTKRVEMPENCAGWEKIALKNSSRYYLLQHDQRLVVNIDAHNLRGRNLGCWQ